MLADGHHLPRDGRRLALVKHQYRVSAGDGLAVLTGHVNCDPNLGEAVGLGEGSCVYAKKQCGKKNPRVHGILRVAAVLRTLALPVLYREAANAKEFSGIVGHENRPDGQGVAGEEDIVRTDGLSIRAHCFQESTDFGRS